ncbi:hypothetical protein D3C87_1748340 [compost metagenome]
MQLAQSWKAASFQMLAACYQSDFVRQKQEQRENECMGQVPVYPVFRNFLNVKDDILGNQFS